MFKKSFKKIIILKMVINSILINSISAEEIKTELEEVVVSATKTEREVREVPTNITILTEEEIKKYDAKDISELLRQIPGFNILAFGSIHADNQVSSRGNRPVAVNVQVLVNGVEYNNPTGYFNVLAIPIGDIERIEIIKSPVSSLYGNFATDGVINIVTKKPKKPIECIVNLSYGIFDTQRHAVVVKGLLNKVEFYGEGRFYKTQGWQDNSWEENKLFNT
ncbi:MAG: TonB-dependent receptor plug domain-containing protein, partial [Thermodesulfobacteriaceae bacterium]|nr:TonB-dependent receptor plug domain-containing protein [Thermodesulfobacteriaceae bacterium]